MLAQHSESQRLSDTESQSSIQSEALQMDKTSIENFLDPQAFIEKKLYSVIAANRAKREDAAEKRRLIRIQALSARFGYLF